MTRISKKSQKKLEIRQRRIFSEEFKKQKVKLLVEKKISISDLCEQYNLSKMTPYRWLYKYSPHYNQGTIQVTQMESEAEKTKYYQGQAAELERLYGQKQIRVEYLEKLVDIASKELGIDLKKTFPMTRLNGSDLE